MEDQQTSTCPVCHSAGRFLFKSKDLCYAGYDLYTYCSCSRCGVIYQYPMPTLADIVNFYPADYSPHSKFHGSPSLRKSQRAVLRYKYGYKQFNEPWIFYLMESLNIFSRPHPFFSFIPDGKGLDIGCGNGEYIATMNSLGWDFTGIDINAATVKNCRDSGLKVFHGELQDVGFNNESFNAVTARHVIEHVKNPDILVREVARILKPGGNFLVQTPNTKALARSFFGRNWFPYDIPRHLVLFNYENLSLLTNPYGLVPICHKTFTKPRIVLRSWDYMRGPRSKPSEADKGKRWLSRPFAWFTMLIGKGDEIFAIYRKP